MLKVFQEMMHSKIVASAITSNKQHDCRQISSSMPLHHLFTSSQSWNNKDEYNTITEIAVPRIIWFSKIFMYFGERIELCIWDTCSNFLITPIVCLLYYLLHIVSKLIFPPDKHNSMLYGNQRISDNLLHNTANRKVSLINLIYFCVYYEH